MECAPGTLRSFFYYGVRRGAQSVSDCYLWENVQLYLIVARKFSILDYMASILIHPESAEQLKTVKAVLKALKVQFEPKSNTLPPPVLKSIER